MRIVKEHFACQRDGLTICGTAYRPEDGGGLPVAIVSHGFMASQGTVRHYAKHLAERGYAAFCFDFCGGCVIGGKSDGATTDMSVLTEVADLEAVMTHALSRPFARPDGLVLMGCSQGGLVSALTAAKHPHRVARLILFYPALCIPDDARAGRMMWARFDPACIPETFRCGPMKLGRRYAADVMAMDLPGALTAYTGETLILHGDRDRIVPLRYSEAAAQAWPTAHLTVIHGAGHGFGAAADRQALAAVDAFLNE